MSSAVIPVIFPVLSLSKKLFFSFSLYIINASNAFRKNRIRKHSRLIFAISCRHLTQLVKCIKNLLLFCKASILFLYLPHPFSSATFCSSTGFSYNLRILIVYLYICHTGFLTFKDFCENVCDEPVPQLKFFEEVNH